MKTLYFFLFHFLSIVSLLAQNYDVTNFQSNYDSISNYKSASIEVLLDGGDIDYWEKEFFFGFAFPFFGEQYDSFVLDSDAVGSFEGAEDFNLFLFGGASYTIAPPQDTNYLPSEVRYKNVVQNNLNALVIEFHNVYNTDEFEENGPNHYMNFQLWFYENGVIEIQFGEIDLDNCTYYFPGYGFSFDNEDPEDNIYGPYVDITNNDLSESACFFGDYENPTITSDLNECSVLTSIPPQGSVIQFSPSTLSSVYDIKNENEKTFSISIENGLFILGELEQFLSVNVYNISGQLIGQSFKRNVELEVSNQFVIVQIIHQNGIETHKIFI